MILLSPCVAPADGQPGSTPRSDPKSPIDELWLDYKITTEETARWLAANRYSDRAISIEWVLIHSNDQIGTNALMMMKILTPSFGNRVASADGFWPAPSEPG